MQYQKTRRRMSARGDVSSEGLLPSVSILEGRVFASSIYLVSKAWHASEAVVLILQNSCMLSVRANRLS